jgi:hypothetical protein
LNIDAIDDYLNGSHFTVIPSKHDAFNVGDRINDEPDASVNFEYHRLADYLTDGKNALNLILVA